MKRIFGVLAVATLALAGCPDNGNKNNIGLDGGSGKDASVAGDMAASTKKATGEPCTKNADCAGNLCLTETMGVFKGGYCSRTCTSDTQCGDDYCYPIGPTQTVCLKYCEANDCRTGYACWTDNVCLPPLADYLKPEVLCDPTKLANTNCKAGQICRRLEHSEDLTSGADKGICDDPCVIGTDTCTNAAGDSPDGYACAMVDNSKIGTVDSMGLYTSDKGIAPKCVAWNLDVVTQNNNGAACSFDYMGTAITFSFACKEESQCAMKDAANVNGYGDPVISGGDDKCYALCYRDGAKPVISPDAGQDGTPFASCPNGTTCKDSFGTFAAPGTNVGVLNANLLPQVGLCRP